MQQALERAGIKSNKGWDYALNALEMANLMHQFREKGSASAYSSYETDAVTTQALPIASNRALVPESTVEHKESANP
jgi:6,7-dimethyl-8-ribityllumazine synthase